MCVSGYFGSVSSFTLSWRRHGVVQRQEHARGGLYLKQEIEGREASVCVLNGRVV